MTPADIEQVATEVYAVVADLTRFGGEIGLLPTV
jgi:hypothetical protein